MKFYVIELTRYIPIRKTYSCIMSSHRFYSSALKARRAYEKQDKRIADKSRKISYAIGRV